MVNTNFSNVISQYVNKMVDKWGWFLVIGIALIILGGIALANMLWATVFSVYFLGAMMLIGGILQFVHAFQMKGAGDFFFWALAGILYALAGFVAFNNPLLASSVLTLFLAVSLIVVGIMRIWQGFKLRRYQVGGGWIIFSGILTLLLGILISLDWPGGSLWVIGMLLGVDLVFQGCSYMGMGFMLRSAKK